jgi:hypothetical protein
VIDVVLVHDVPELARARLKMLVDIKNATAAAMTRSRSESSLKSDFLSVKTGIASLTVLMLYMAPETLKRKPCYTAEQTVYA